MLHSRWVIVRTEVHRAVRIIFVVERAACSALAQNIHAHLQQRRSLVQGMLLTVRYLITLDSKYTFQRTISVPYRRPPSACSTRRVLMRPNILRQGVYAADAVHGPDTAPRAPLVPVRGVEPRLCGLPQPSDSVKLTH